MPTDYGCPASSEGRSINHGFDDATRKLMQLLFVPSESTASYFQALRGYLKEHGCPVAFYSDKHSVFRVNRSDARGGAGMIQFGRALAELKIEILCAKLLVSEPLRGRERLRPLTSIVRRLLQD